MSLEAHTGSGWLRAGTVRGGVCLPGRDLTQSEAWFDCIEDRLVSMCLSVDGQDHTLTRMAWPCIPLVWYLNLNLIPGPPRWPWESGH